MKTRILLAMFLLKVGCPAQNVVDDSRTAEVWPAVKMDGSRVEKLISARKQKLQNPSDDAGVTRVRMKLTRHVEALVQGWPWRSFHCTLGISGSETYFDHPDQLFHALTMALPHLPRELQSRVRELLARQLSETPPYGVTGFERDKGRERERYAVPANLRTSGRGNARSLFGVAAFEAYLASDAIFSTDGKVSDRLAPHWDALKQRVGAYLEAVNKSDLEKTRGVVDLEVINGDLAGLIGFARLAGPDRDLVLYEKTLHKIGQLAQIRVNVERTDAQLLATASTASKRLHHVRLARLGNFHPNLVEIFNTDERQLAARRLKSFREARPGWWMTFGDRYIGGENYISPPHFSHALFTGAALFEEVDRSTLADWVDVPWCEADLFFIEKCALAVDGR